MSEYILCGGTVILLFIGTIAIWLATGRKSGGDMQSYKIGEARREDSDPYHRSRRISKYGPMPGQKYIAYFWCETCGRTYERWIPAGERPNHHKGCPRCGFNDAEQIVPRHQGEFNALKDEITLNHQGYTDGQIEDWRREEHPRNYKRVDEYRRRR